MNAIPDSPWSVIRPFQGMQYTLSTRGERLANTSALDPDFLEYAAVEPTEESAFPTEDSFTPSSAEGRELEELKARDREVRAHEQAHQAAGGAYASAPSYTYRRGPDGRLYAVEGSVRVNLSSIPGDPEATARKAKKVADAALASGDPSASDLHVAAKAERMADHAEKKAEAEEPPAPRPRDREEEAGRLFQVRV